MRRWAIFYSARSGHGVLQGGTLKEWDTAPLDGVLGVIQADDNVCRIIWSGTEKYYRTPRGSVVGYDDLSEYLIRTHGGGPADLSREQLGRWLRERDRRVKHGEMVEDDEWADAVARMRAFEDIPRDGPRSPRPEAGIKAPRGRAPWPRKG